MMLRQAGIFGPKFHDSSRPLINQGYLGETLCRKKSTAVSCFNTVFFDIAVADTEPFEDYVQLKQGRPLARKCQDYGTQILYSLQSR